MPKTIAVRFDGAAEEAVDLEAWAAENAEDATTVAVVRALKPGESTHFGGGAAPLVSIRMLDTDEANAVARRTFLSVVA